MLYRILKISIVYLKIFVSTFMLKGTMQRALGVIQGAFEQGSGQEGSIHLEEYFVQKHVRLVDTRGFFESDEKLFEECLNIMSGRYYIQSLVFLEINRN